MKLFIDIETVKQLESIHHMPDGFRLCYEKKFGHELENNVPGKYDCFEDHYDNKAALYAEFGKVVCISMGYMNKTEQRLISFCSDDEKDILTRASEMIDNIMFDGLVAHNGKDFDYPFLCRRMIVNQVKLPRLLMIQNLKPWEIKLEDTVEMWKFGQLAHRVSLATLCHLFAIPSPKQDVDGSMVSDLYAEKDFAKIAQYCEGDVRALMQVYDRLKN
jgi:predicted PolB exonuclease-like 3'-5' exonuclease